MFQNEKNTTETYIITLLSSNNLSDKLITTCCQIITTPILSSKKLSHHAWQGTFQASSSLIKKYRQHYLHLCEQFHLDIVIYHVNSIEKSPKLAVFDMDSTLIKNEVIDEMGREMNCFSKISSITEQAMQGKMDFSQSLKERMLLLSQMHESHLDNVFERIEINPGVSRVFRVLEKLRCKTAIISGGFTYFAHRLREKLKIDHIFANQFEIIDHRLTGRLIGPIIDRQEKKHSLVNLMSIYQLQSHQVIAMGDGSNDIAMLQEAGLGIAFHAKPLVIKQMSTCISYSSFDSLLYLLGWSEQEIGHLLA